MKIAVIDKKDIVLKTENNTIKFETQTIPFKLMDMLILNHRATLHTSDILKLTKENISILLIGHNNDNFSIINSANTKNGELKLQQYNSLKNRLTFAKYFLKQKFISHQEHLKSLDVEVDIKSQLQQLDDAKEIEEMMGIEGAFARLYFQHYFAQLPKNLHKNRRSKQPPQDPVNALLSYWYSLYYNIITVKLLSHGFEPSMGYLHTPFRKHNALASDILELFRSTINQAVLSVFKAEMLTAEDFSKKGGVYLKYDGRRKVWSVFVELVQLLQPQLNDAVAKMKRDIDETL